MEPYKHKLGEFKPEHFDGDPIDQPVTPARQAQIDESLKRLSRTLGLPENAIERERNKNRGRG
jgi:hypothetical protein